MGKGGPTTGKTDVMEHLEVLEKGTDTPLCYQCSRCTSACPAALGTGVFNPRMIILALLLGEDIAQFEDDTIWMCVTCHSCEEACPKGVKVAMVMHLLRNEAGKKGKAPAAYMTNAGLLLASGLVANMATVERTRKQFGLGPMDTPDMGEMEKMLMGTQMKKGGGK